MSELTQIDTYDEFRHNGVTDGTHYKFKNCEFNIDVHITNAHYIEFINCVFNDRFRIERTVSSSTNLQSCVFNDEAHFQNGIFAGKVRMQSCSFNKRAYFDNTTFSDLCDFWNTTFGGYTIFYKTDFLKTVVFSRTTFKKNVLFTYTLIQGIAIFRGTVFNEGLDFSTALISGTLNLFDFKLNSFDSIKGEIDENDYEDYINNQAKIPDKNKRETYRIVKQQFKKQDNNISSIDYRALEFKSYASELKNTFFTRHNRMQNSFVLFLNFISNNYGKSWLRGVGFTLGCTLIFFYLLLISTNHYQFGIGLPYEDFQGNGKLFFDFLNPTHKTSILKSLEPNVSTYFIDFIGRIFITYGIYQTVQAFRKYK